MNKGEDWRLCAGYIRTDVCPETKTDTTHYVWILPAFFSPFERAATNNPKALYRNDET